MHLLCVPYLQLLWCVWRELQLPFAYGQIENDLHGVLPTPGPLAGVHLPQQNTKGIHIN